jgi:transposase
MAKVLVDDALWELIEPHLPRPKPRRTGRPRVPDRAPAPISWLRQFKRLRVRCERRADIHETFLALGCILICCRIVVRVS